MSSSGSSSTRDKSELKQHRCEICGKTFDSLDTLNSHKRLDHSESGISQFPADIDNTSTQLDFITSDNSHS